MKEFKEINRIVDNALFNTETQIQTAIESLPVPKGLSNKEANDLFEDRLVTSKFVLATKGKAFFTKASKVINESLLKAVTDVEAGTSTVIGGADGVEILLEVKNPAKRIDNTKFQSELRKAGVSEEVVAKALEAATTYNAPAKSLKIVS